MSAAVRTSACVDCATPIIGDRLRCPACHEDHAEAIARVPVPVDVAPPERGRVPWAVIVEVIAVIGGGLVLAVLRGCVQ